SLGAPPIERLIDKCQRLLLEICQRIRKQARYEKHASLSACFVCKPRRLTMAKKPEELLPSAGDFMKKLALAEADEASKQARQNAEAEAEKKALLDKL